MNGRRFRNNYFLGREQSQGKRVKRMITGDFKKGAALCAFQRTCLLNLGQSF